MRQVCNHLRRQGGSAHAAIGSVVHGAIGRQGDNGLGEKVMENTLGRSIVFGFLFSIFLSAVGFTGNHYWLGEDWANAHTLMAQIPLPYPRWVRELISISFDPIYSIVMFWMFSKFADRSVLAALKLTVWFWVIALVMLYAAMVNSMMIPWEVSVKTCLVGLVGALPAAIVMPLVFRDRSGPGNGG
jgi:hypothetical protein